MGLLAAILGLELGGCGYWICVIRQKTNFGSKPLDSVPLKHKGSKRNVLCARTHTLPATSSPWNILFLLLLCSLNWAFYLLTMDKSSNFSHSSATHFHLTYFTLWLQCNSVVLIPHHSCTVEKGTLQVCVRVFVLKEEEQSEMVAGERSIGFEAL